MIPEKKLAILYHIFYEDILDHIFPEIEHLLHYKPYFLFNISADTPNQIEIKNALVKYFPGAVVTISTNKGKDIGGKLLLLNICIQLGIQPDWIIFLHDKKSLHALNAKTWKNGLLKIIEEKEIDKIISLIDTNKNCGIIGAADYVRKEQSEDGKLVSINASIMEQLQQQYNVDCKDSYYVAGTMFWGKASVLLGFFKKNDPLKIRQTLEDGNVIDNFKGTHTHSWERLLCWIITSQKLEIKTV